MDCKEVLMRLVRAIKRLLLASPDQAAEIAAAKADARLAHEQLAALQSEAQANALTESERAEVTETLNLVAAASPPEESGASGASGPSGETGPEGGGLPAAGEGTGAALNGAFVTGVGVQGIGDRAEGETITSPDIQSASGATGESGPTGSGQ
jgi:hypothetical protein